jgi:SAM-dependent methyltransferase
MYRSVYDLKSFYNSAMGRMVRRILRERIREFWPNVRGLRVMGCGYATPYLRMYNEEEGAERVVAIMPVSQGAHDWPPEGPCAVALAESAELPIETNSIDRVILIHDLEFSEFLKSQLQEVWRVLKSNGRLLVIVPNRAGFWARADWSPFGLGTPYSASQIEFYLRDNMFVHERTEGALYVPPIRSGVFLRSAEFFEKHGRKFLPFMAGVHMVEASKQIYATMDRSGGSKVRVRGRGVMMPKPVATPFQKF